jgi:threonine aldolase
VQANAVFATLPRAAIAPLQARWFFHVWDEPAGEVRWMCAWDTTAEEVDAFVAEIAAAVAAA